MISEKLAQVIEEKLGDLGSLPSLPDAVLKISEIVNDPNSSMRQVETVMEVDPVLSSTVLKVVNSSFYGMAQEISALRLALVILGIKEIKNLVLSLSIFRLFSESHLNGNFNLRDFWQHSATTGQIAKSLSQKLNLQFAGEEFVGGLIHDIGKLVMLKCLPEEYQSCHRQSHMEKIPLHQVELETFGFHHGQVGGWLANRWHLPKKLEAAITYHIEPQSTPDYHQLVGIVSLSSSLAQAAGMQTDSVFEAFFIQDHPATQLLLDYTLGLDTIDWERFTMELGTDVQKSIEFVSLSQNNLWQAQSA